MSKDRVVRLPLFGAVHEIALPVPGGRGALGLLMPAARRLNQAVTSAAVERERSEGRRVTCAAGCAACCRHLVPISTVEAQALAGALKRLPTKRRQAVEKRFEVALARLESAGLARGAGSDARTALVASPGAPSAWQDVSSRYQALAIACPFLEDERCVAYDDRPFACREHMVTTDPAACATGEGARAVPRPAYMTPALGAVATELDGVEPAIFPLPFMLEWLQAHAAELGHDHAGEDALDVLLAVLEPSEEAGA